jgi:hypothetical protein
MPKAKKKGHSSLVCPKKVKVGKKVKKVTARDGMCYVPKKDGGKAKVRKVKRGHKGYGSFAKSSKK